MLVEEIDNGIQRFGAHGVLLKQDLMVRAFNDVRFTPPTRVARRGAKFTEAVVRAVIHHTFQFCLE